MKFKISKVLAARNHSFDMDLVLLIVRVIVGYAFIMHGWGKIQAATHWMGPDSPVPGFLQFLAALSEFGGGIALIVGLLTRLAALGLLCTMSVAVFMHAYIMGDPFVAMGPGGRSFELALIYLIISLLLLISGPGRFSLDRKVFGSK
ncbi:MAG: DoxX family protein [Deltaproteobacteria bacterium]|nr:DoxX family protein [Deltaproteobacteria bacterium]